MDIEIPQEIIEKRREAEQCLVPANLRAAGWIYRDVPAWFSPEMWDHFLGVLGDGNYQILAMTDHNVRGKRGQFLLSPQAVENLKAHAASRQT